MNSHIKRWPALIALSGRLEGVRFLRQAMLAAGLVGLAAAGQAALASYVVINPKEKPAVGASDENHTGQPAGGADLSGLGGGAGARSGGSSGGMGGQSGGASGDLGGGGFGGTGQHSGSTSGNPVDDSGFSNSNGPGFVSLLPNLSPIMGALGRPSEGSAIPRAPAGGAHSQESGGGSGGGGYGLAGLPTPPGQLTGNDLNPPGGLQTQNGTSGAGEGGRSDDSPLAFLPPDTNPDGSPADNDPTDPDPIIDRLLPDTTGRDPEGPPPVSNPFPEASVPPSGPDGQQPLQSLIPGQVPEPITVLLLGAGLGVLAYGWRRGRGAHT